MESELVMGYLVYVDDNLTAVGKSLDEAKQVGGRYVSDARRLKITSAVAPAPTQVWIYDHSIQMWVEQK